MHSPSVFTQVLCKGTQVLVSRDRKVTCPSRGHFFLSYTLLLVGANIRKSACGHSCSQQNSPTWKRCGSSWCRLAFLLQPRYFSPDGRYPPGAVLGLVGRMRVQDDGQLPWPACPSWAGLGCPAAPLPPLQPACHRRDSENTPQTILNSMDFCLFV